MASAAPAMQAGETLKGKPGKFKCPDCPYAAMTAGSLAGHISMAHPGVAAPAPVETFPPIDQAIAGAVGVPVSVAARGPQLVEVDLDLIDIAENVRVDPGDLADLAANIAELGVLQPIRVVGPTADGRYRAVWGQRRILASRQAKRTTIPALVELEADVDKPGARRSIEQLAENLVRKDLNPIEEAVAIRQVLDADPDLRQRDLGAKLGRSDGWVSNMLRLLELAEPVQDKVRAGVLSTAHAKAVLSVPSDLQAEFAEEAIRSKWTSSDTERQAKWKNESAARTRADIAAAERAERMAKEAIASLEKVANRKTAVIAAGGYGYGIGDRIAKLLKADGWDVVPNDHKVEKVAKAGACGCTGVWRVSAPYYSESKEPASVEPACRDAEHAKLRQKEREAGWARDREKANAERKAEAAAQAVRTGQLAKQLEAAPLNPFSLRLAIYALVTGEGDDAIFRVLGIDEDDGDDDTQVEDLLWAGLTGVPDEALTGIFARAIAEALDDDWRLGKGIKAAIAAALPAPEPEPAPAIKRKKLGKEPRLDDPVIDGEAEYVVLSITGRGADPRETWVVELAHPGPVKARDYRVPASVVLGDLEADRAANVWRLKAAAP